MTKFLSKINKQEGVATLEMMIAMVIIVLAISGVILVVFGGQSTAVGTQTNQEALYKAQAMLEGARALARQDLNLVQNCDDASATKCTAYGVVDSFYSRKLTVTLSPDGLSKSVVGEVTWGSGHYIRLSTILSDWRSSLTACNPTLTDTTPWQNPQHYDFPSQSLLPGNGSNGLGISALQAYKGKLYVTATTPPNSNDTFYVFDLPANPAQPPPYLGSLDNDSAVATGPHALAVAPSGNKIYAYLASPSSFVRGQLQIVDVTTPGSLPAPITFKIPASAVPAAGLGNSIFYNNGYVYLGLTAAAGGKEFNVIDVHTPTSPVWKGGYSTGGQDVRSIFVKGSYAYIATANSENITVLDVSDPTNPHRVSGYTPPNAPGTNGAGSNQGKSVFGVGSGVYLGRTYGTNEFYMLNTDGFGNVSLNAGKDIGAGTATNINGLAVRGNLAFLITDSEFQVWNITTPSNPSAWATPLAFSDFTNGNGNGTGTALNCSGSYFYMALTSPQGNNKDIISIITPHINSVYTLSNSGNISVAQGQSGTNTITATVSSGFPPSTSFSASGLPAGATASFNPTSCVPGCSSTLTISTSFPATPAGSYPITVTGTGGVTTTFNLVVSAQAFDYSLSNSGNITTTQGASGSNTVTRTLVSGTAQPVTLSASGLPAGATASFTNNPCSPTCTSTLTIATSYPATPVGSYPITITGTGGKTTSFNLVVNSPFDYSLSNSNSSTPLKINRNSSGSTIVTRTLVSGITKPITLTASGLPAKTSGSFTNNPCSPTCSSTFNITVQNPATPGSYTITVTGTAGDLGARSTTFTLVIQ